MVEEDLYIVLFHSTHNKFIKNKESDYTKENEWETQETFLMVMIRVKGKLSILGEQNTCRCYCTSSSMDLSRILAHIHK